MIAAESIKNYYAYNLEERQYHDIIKNIIKDGSFQNDRTETGTKVIFAPPPMRFNLESFPLLTTKKIFLRPIFEELMWFIRGQTNAIILSNKKVYIWDANASRAALDKRGLSYKEGDLGPIYGFQWRHFGAKYINCDTDYTGQGVDQLRQVINSIMFNPTDRRIVLTAWNPVAIPFMALPPCHMFCQFFVAHKTLSCQLYQRSADVGLGVPFNIASYSLLTMMIAHLCGLKPGEFIHVIGNAHIYTNHLNVLNTQIQRSPKPFPKLTFAKESPNFSNFKGDKDMIIDYIIKSLEEFEFTDIKLIGYDSWPTIHMDMSV